jgi:hypothetical protein
MISLRAFRCCAAVGALIATAFSSLAWAYSVYGAIGDKYTALGREGGALGSAMSDESDAPYGGRFNKFQNGFIYWHRDIGAYAVWGAIGQKWDQVGRVAFGYPITDELKTPDGRGRYNHFRAIHLPGRPESSIYWTPQTGPPHAIYGAIRSQWASMGWERSWLGYPIGDEVQDGAYRRTAFENGFIRWTAAGGQSVKTDRAPQEGGGFAFIPVDGLRVLADAPGSAQPVVAYDDPFVFAPSELCAGFLDRPELDATIRNTLIARIRGKLPSGFGIHSQTNHQLGTTCSSRSEFAVSKLSIRIVVPNNRLFIRMTTPNGFPGGLDPNFVLTYDLTLRTSITFPASVAGSVVQGPVMVVATNISRPQTNSITGNLTLASDDLVRFLGGDGFVSAMRQGGASQLPGIDTGVNTLNAKLNQVRASAPSGVRLDSYQQGDLVIVLATNRPQSRGPR